MKFSQVSQGSHKKELHKIFMMKGYVQKLQRVALKKTPVSCLRCLQLNVRSVNPSWYFDNENSFQPYLNLEDLYPTNGNASTRWGSFYGLFIHQQSINENCVFNNLKKDNLFLETSKPLSLVKCSSAPFFYKYVLFWKVCYYSSVTAF